MMKKLIKCSVFFMGVFSIFSLIRNGSPKMPSKISTDAAQVLSNEVRDGAADSGFILFSVNSNSALN